MLRMQNWCRLKALINVMESGRGAEGRVVHEYWRQDCLVSFDTVATTTGLFMGRRERKKTPNKTQTKYTGLDIPCYVVMERWELFEFARKVNNRREAVRELVRQYIAKEKLLRQCIATVHSREEAMKLLRPLTAKEQSVVINAMEGTGPLSEILVNQGRDTVQRGSMQTLRPGQWLGNEVINHFLKNCLARPDEKLYAKDPRRRQLHFFNSFFMQMMFNEKNNSPQLRGRYNYKNVRCWSNKVPGKDIFNLKYMFCPINLDDMH